MSEPPLLRVRGLRWTAPQADRPLFDGLDLDIPGGVSLVCGDEGRGKSTLLRLLAGRLQAQAGGFFTDRSLLEPDLQALSIWHDASDPSFDAIEVQALLEQLVPSSQRADLPALVEGLSLGLHLHKPLYQLSSGSRRKVFIAASLACKGLLTLLDQPFTALDVPSIAFLRQQFAARAQERRRALLIADYTAPQGVALTSVINLDR
jgi:ABC-type transport system involved in cytochrome c biogenesis ATPase subunit